MSHKMSWTQPACNNCWFLHNPGRPPHRILQVQRETCCYCGTWTESGIYVRVDPTTVPSPTIMK